MRLPPCPKCQARATYLWVPSVAMRWEDERYVRIFTRDTPTWDALGWEAQTLLVFVFRKMDRTGLLELGGSGARGLAASVRMPLDVVERALAVLLADGVLSMLGTNLFCKNFMAAQECPKSDSLRSKEKRERAHLRLTQSVSQLPQSVAQTPRSDTSAPRSDTPSVPSVPSVPSDPPIAPQGGQSTTRPRRAARAVGSEAFEAFWQAYPQHRHVEKAGALREWPGDEHAPAIMAALAWQTHSHDWTKSGGEFVPHPKRYLAKKRWADERPQQGALIRADGRTDLPPPVAYPRLVP